MKVNETLELLDRAKTKCRSCGKSVVFVTDANGRKQVLDTVAPVFLVTPDGSSMRCTRTPVAFVSHFATCRFATQHSKKNQPASEGSVIHGKTCQKVEHVAGKNYLHESDDDRPYEVDNLLYCGRCHTFLDGATI